MRSQARLGRRCTEAQMVPALSTTRNGDQRRIIPASCRSTASKWKPVAHSLSASILICTKSFISLSGAAVDCLSASAGWREHVYPRLFPAYQADGGTQAKKEKDLMAKQYR